MDTTIIAATIPAVLGIISSIVTFKIGQKKSHEDNQSKAINLCLHSNWWILHALQKLKDENGEPLINGESHKLADEIEEFQLKQVEANLKR